MANPTTLVSNLVVEVCNILKLDNVDPRVHEWVGMAYNDLCQRAPCHIFHNVAEVTVASGATSVTLSDEVGMMVAAIFRNNGICYMAQYVTPGDYSRLVSTGSTATASTVPLYWTVEKVATTQKLEVYPTTSGDTAVTLIWSGNYEATPPSGSSLLKLPYHFEGALVWGAAALGALLMRPELYAICQAEYEEAIQDMLFVLSYYPDTEATMRSIGTPFVGGVSPALQASQFGQVTPGS